LEITSGWPKITGQFGESRSATPPPDVFWRVRSCILFQLDFPLQAEKSRFPGQRVERPFSRPVELGRQRASAAERDADVANEPVGIPAGESMVITEIWQDRHRNVQNSHTLRTGRD
jgi:hypothetical protein